MLGLGCENNQMEELLARAGDIDRIAPARSSTPRTSIDELEEGTGARREAGRARSRRTSAIDCPVSELVIGHKCGGSDGFSGITANALLGDSPIASRRSAAACCSPRCRRCSAPSSC